MRHDRTYVDPTVYIVLWFDCSQYIYCCILLTSFYRLHEPCFWYVWRLRWQGVGWTGRAAIFGSVESMEPLALFTSVRNVFLATLCFVILEISAKIIRRKCAIIHPGFSLTIWMTIHCFESKIYSAQLSGHPFTPSSPWFIVIFVIIISLSCDSFGVDFYRGFAYYLRPRLVDLLPAVPSRGIGVGFPWPGPRL